VVAVVAAEDAVATEEAAAVVAVAVVAADAVATVAAIADNRICERFIPSGGRRNGDS
jgi:hypothetical protein